MAKKYSKRKKTIKPETPIHIKLEPSEAIESQRNVLSSELTLIKILTRIRNYKKYRLLELDKKTEAKKTLRQISLNITKIENLFPKLEIPKILQPEDEKPKTKPQTKEIKKIPKEKTIKPADPLEAQLLEIKAQLQALE